MLIFTCGFSIFNINLNGVQIMSNRTRLFIFLICLSVFSTTAFAQTLAIDSSFAPTTSGGLSSAVNFIEIQSDQKILIAGNFTSVNGVTRNKIARLNADGSLDASFNAGSVIDQGALISSMEILPDGKILVGGAFGNVGTNMNQLKVVLRLNSDGSLDGGFTSFPYISGGGVKKAKALASGKILICGNLQMPNGNDRFWLARYNFDGTYDSTFTTTINSNCEDVEVQPDGKYYIAGLFTTVNGISKPGLARFNTDDSIDPAFTAQPFPGGNGTSYEGIELQNDGRIIGFQSIVPVGRKLARLNNDGSTNVLFPITTNFTYDVAFQPNGKMLVAGNFNNPSGVSDQFVRFNTDGTLDQSSNLLNFCCNYPRAVAVQADGKVIVGGDFETINGATKPKLVRFLAQPIQRPARFDFDGDGKADVSVFRPGNSVWYLNQSSSGFFAAQWGLSNDKPVPADYDGDGKADIAVFRDGVFYYLRSSDFSFFYRLLGQAGDIPQPGDYWSNELGEFVVYRPSDQTWYLTGADYPYGSWNTRMNLALSTDIPVSNDFDGDGKMEIALFRDGKWYSKKLTSTLIVSYQFGLAGDKPVAADYDGDGRADYAVFRPSNGVWYIQGTSQGFYAVQWGLPDDIPVPADYDGDGKTDIAVYRDGAWYQYRSTSGFYGELFGLAGDIPAQAR